MNMIIIVIVIGSFKRYLSYMLVVVGVL